MQQNRRSFAKDCLVTGVSSMVACQAIFADGNETEPGWIDAHVHVWSPDLDRFPLDAQFDPVQMVPKSFTDSELFDHCRPSGVDRVVLIQMNFYGLDHRYMFEVMQNNPGVFSAVALIDFQSEGLLPADVTAKARELVSQGVRGFRLHSMGDAHAWPDNPLLHALWQTAAEDGFAVCPLINPGDIEFIEQLCRKHPDARVVIDHFARIGLSGQIEQDRLESLCRLAKFSNVFVKTSAFYALGKKQPPYSDLLPMIRSVLDAFGPERLMWASDCPFQVQGEHNYQASLDLILRHADFLSPGDKQWLLRDTAERVFFS
jgi:predicted TIM-barrel fold metal-dependent hydrolase